MVSPGRGETNSWTQVWDEEFQRYYYYNKYTNESVWERPDNCTVETPRSQPDNRTCAEDSRVKDARTPESRSPSADVENRSSADVEMLRVRTSGEAVEHRFSVAEREGKMIELLVSDSDDEDASAPGPK